LAALSILHPGGSDREPVLVRVMQLRRLRCTGHVTHMSEQLKIFTRFPHLRNTSVAGKILLNTILEKQDVKVATAFKWHTTMQWCTSVDYVCETIFLRREIND
jgi:hypothetical protein